MESIRAVLFLVVAFVGLLVASLLFLGGIEETRPGFPTAPSQVVLVSKPELSKVKPDFCTGNYFGGSCQTPLRISNLVIKSNYTGDVGVVISYKDQEWLVPCGTGLSRSGPCALTGDRTLLDLELEIIDKVSLQEGKLDPPTLNLSERNSITKWWVPHRQQIILGNYVFFVRNIISALVDNKAQVTIECNKVGTLGRETKVVFLEEGESAVVGLCEGSVRLAVNDLTSSIVKSTKASCLDINVNGAPSWAGLGDLVKVSFWKHNPDFRGEQTLQPCGNLPQEFLREERYFDKLQFSTPKALEQPRCVNAFLGSFELYAEVEPYDPGTSSWETRTCD